MFGIGLKAPGDAPFACVAQGENYFDSEGISQIEEAASTDNQCAGL